MNRKLYVGNLPYAYTSDELREAFEPHGSVQSAIVIMDRKTGRSRGFGFVEYETEDDARTAMEEINGTSVGGRNVIVSEARERPQDSGPSAPPDEG